MEVQEDRTHLRGRGPDPQAETNLHHLETRNPNSRRRAAIPDGQGRTAIAPTGGEQLPLPGQVERYTRAIVPALQKNRATPNSPGGLAAHVPWPNLSLATPSPRWKIKMSLKNDIGDPVVSAVTSIVLHACRLNHR